GLLACRDDVARCSRALAIFREACDGETNRYRPSTAYGNEQGRCLRLVAGEPGCGIQYRDIGGASRVAEAPGSPPGAQPRAVIRTPVFPGRISACSCRRSDAGRDARRGFFIVQGGAPLPGP